MDDLGTVLVADDDERDRRAAMRGAQRALPGACVECFTGGRALLTRLRSGGVAGPFVILLDMDMPGGDGWEVISALAPGYPGWERVPIAVLTSSSVHEEILRERGLQLPTCLEKPPSPAAICQFWQRMAINTPESKDLLTPGVARL